MTRPSGYSVLTAYSSVVLAALFLGSGPPVSAGIFGAAHNDVVVKVAELRIQDKNAMIRGLDFSPDGNRLAEDSDGTLINIWDWRNKRIDKSISAPRGFNPVGTQNGLLFSPDGRFLAACADRDGDVLVHLWNTSDWSPARGITDSGNGMCGGISFSPNGQALVLMVDRTGRAPDKVMVHAVGSWNLTSVLPLLQELDFYPVAVSVGPDSDLVAVAGAQSILRNKEVVYEPNIELISIRRGSVTKIISTEAGGPLAWTRDGKTIATAGGKGGVEIFDVSSGQRLSGQKFENAGSMNVRFTPDGRYFILSDMNGMRHGLGVKIWDAQMKTLLQLIPGDIGSIAVSRDSKYLAVGETGCTTIWQFK
jgi:WD40 repeat protein